MSSPIILLLLLLVLLAPGYLIAQPAPYHHYQTLDTPHFHVHVARGLEREGRVAGAAAERAYALLSRELKAPRGMIDLVVSDDADYSNGFATPLPTNRIVVFATQPVESNSLRLNEDWLQVVITHELTHIFHLDRADGIWGFAQRIFGRAPDLFPNAYSPSWITEGLAVYYESRLTEGGRLRGSEHRMLARAAALENPLPRINEWSLGSPIFPGGERSYAYGSLFLDYISRTRGDSAIPALVNAQSRAINPFRLNHIASRAFGTTFEGVYATWSDSIMRSVRGRPERSEGPALAVRGRPEGTEGPALAVRGRPEGTEGPVFRDITTHPYAAVDPRWTSDTTLIYAGNDGRSTAAEYVLNINGTRSRIGRRNSLGASVPLPDGSLVFSQLELASPSEVRSDLFVEKDGVQRRLTNGLRLVQPDVRRDSVIVAVQLAPSRTNLVLLDLRTGERRTLRDATSDETWSEPRWSPDGQSVAAIHRPHGGVFSLEVIDVTTNQSRILDRGRYILSTPAWADASTVLYTSEASGIPSLMRASTTTSDVRVLSGDIGSAGLSSAELSPNGKLLAAVALRANGYHVAISPAPARDAQPVTASPARAEAAIDSQPLATGEYRAYSAWKSVLPRYWYPLVEDAPGGSTRVGFTTSGRDAVYRHLYDGYFELPLTGQYPTGRFTYRYAGLRRPFVDLELSQDITADFTFQNGGTGAVVGTLLRRTQNASLATTFTRPRVRTFTSLSLGGAFERRNFISDPGQFLVQLDTAYGKEYRFPSMFLSGSWSNTQRPSLSISAEDGISFSFTARERARVGSFASTRSASVVAATSMYKSLDLPGFAHHVLALRTAAGIADRRAASSFQVGGVSGTTVQVVTGRTLGDGRRTFGVRGFPPATLFGTAAMSGSLEYRAPLSLGGHGFGNFPIFFDRAALTAFADGGVTSCASSPLVPSVCAPVARQNHAIASTGAELLLSASLIDWDIPQSMRFGFAVPVVGRTLVPVDRVSVYLAYGVSF